MSQRGLFYGWVVVFAAATVVAFGQGSLFSLGVFLKPLEESMHWSRSAVSVTAFINWMAMGVGSFLWGAISDRLGSRFVTIGGGLLLRSEEHTSELQSLAYLVCRLLLEKKKRSTSAGR